MAEGGGLLNRYTAITRIVGSNPIPSASLVSESVRPYPRTSCNLRLLTDMAMTMTLRRMERGHLTVHGFRSTFRDWAAERTGFPPEVAEMALAHTVADKVEAAYRRGDLFQKRGRLMDGWAKFCATPAPAGKVVSFAAAK